MNLKLSIRFSTLLILGALLVPVSGQAARWQLFENQYFSVLSSASKKKTLAVMGELEKFRVAVQSVTAGRIPAEAPRTPVVLFGSRKEFFDRYSLGPGIAGYAVPLAGRSLMVLPVLNASPKTMLIVRHEYIHALLRYQNLQFPIWLEEGIAELLATTVISENQFEYGTPSKRRKSNFSRGVSLELIIRNRADPYSRDEYAIYWLLAHFLLVGNDLAYIPKLRQFLDSLSAGEGPVSSFEQAFGMPPDELWNTEILDYSEAIPSYTFNFDPGMMDTDFVIMDAPEETVSETLTFLAAHAGRPDGEEVSKRPADVLEGDWQEHKYVQDCVDGRIRIRFADDRDRLIFSIPGRAAADDRAAAANQSIFDIRRIGRRKITLTRQPGPGEDKDAGASKWELKFLSDHRICLRQPDWLDGYCRPSFVRCPG